MKKKKKEKKCYLSCTSIQRMKFQRALVTKYQLMFTDSIEDADMFVAPMDLNGLTEKQKREFERAEILGIAERVAVSEKIILDQNIEDPLSLNLEKEDEKIEAKEEIMEEDEGFELELV